jgi:type IV pilus assembly protein PilM
MNIPYILENIINLVSKKEESVLGVDVGGSAIKIVQLRKKNGRALLETYGEVALGPYTDVDIGRSVRLPSETLAVALKDVIRESRKDIVKSEGDSIYLAGISIPLVSSLITVANIPNLSEKNFDQIVAIEARKYIPVSMSEISLDWQILPPYQGAETVPQGVQGVEEKKEISQGETEEVKPETQTTPNNERKISKVLIVAVHTDAISRMRELFLRTGLKEKFIEVEAFSSMRSCVNRDSGPLAIVDHGASATKVYIVDEGVVRVSHTIAVGSQDFTLAISRATSVPVKEAELLKRESGLSVVRGGVDLGKIMEGSLSYMISEVDRIISDYERLNNRTIGEIVLSGGGVGLKGLPELFEKSLKYKMRIADPFSMLDAPAFLDSVLKEAGPSFTVAIGAGLRALESE